MADNTEYKFPIESDADIEKAKRPCLIMIKGDFIGQVYELSLDVTMMGRSDDLDLVISDISISRRHAMIAKRLGTFFVSDLSSTNGTFVNKELVTDAYQLEEGDKLTLGEVTFKFSFQDADDTQYHQMLRSMAIQDGLTQIYNKRYFDDQLAKEFDYNRRNQSGLSIVMFDIDHFKCINDTYGHPAGDAILKGLAILVEKEARAYDVFARYGGEEFILLIRGMDKDAANILAERIRASVEEKEFEYDGTILKITVSIGVCFWDGGPSMESPEQLIDKVDKYLYDAKNKGRNRIQF